MTNLRAKEAQRAAQVFQAKRMTEDGKPNNFFEQKEFGTTSNKEVANILETAPKTVEAAKASQPKVSLEAAAWDDNEIEIDEDDMVSPQNDAEETKDGSVETTSEIFVPPSAGSHPFAATVKKNPLNAAINIAAGNFDKGLELLTKSIAVVNFDPLKPLFVDTYTLNKMLFQPLPHGPAFEVSLKSSGSMPLLPFTLTIIEEKIALGIELTTKAEFQNALKTFRNCLHSITMLAISQAETKKIAVIVRKLVEYITFLRIELERKKSADEKGSEVRTNELGCYMTVCGVEIVHKFLAYKSAFALSYKLNNFITAAHFARLIVDLEPSGVSY